MQKGPICWSRNLPLLWHVGTRPFWGYDFDLPWFNALLIRPLFECSERQINTKIHVSVCMRMCSSKQLYAQRYSVVFAYGQRANPAYLEHVRKRVAKVRRQPFRLGKHTALGNGGQSQKTGYWGKRLFQIRVRREVEKKLVFWVEKGVIKSPPAKIPIQIENIRRILSMQKESINSIVMRKTQQGMQCSDTTPLYRNIFHHRRQQNTGLLVNNRRYK